MFRSSPSLLRPSNYLYREPHFPYKKSKAWYKFKFGFENRLNPQANRDDASTWTNPLETRQGGDWYMKHRRRHQYVGWPYISWQNDPIRHHKDTAVSNKTLSKKMERSGNAGFPLWDHYEESGLDYGLPNDATVAATHPFLVIHCGSTWSDETITAFLSALGAKFPTVSDVSTRPDDVRAWRDSTPEGHKVAPGFVEHMILCCRDILRNNSKKDYRRLLHSKGYLRTSDMVRYHALPYLKDGHPVMPEKLEQPAGREYQGDYVWLSPNAHFHETTQPRAHRRQSFYDA
jgi:hypothetical protein